jgi:hypothetical protein
MLGAARRTAQFGNDSCTNILKKFQCTQIFICQVNALQNFLFCVKSNLIASKSTNDIENSQDNAQLFVCRVYINCLKINIHYCTKNFGLWAHAFEQLSNFMEVCLWASNYCRELNAAMHSTLSTQLYELEWKNPEILSSNYKNLRSARTGQSFE